MIHTNTAFKSQARKVNYIDITLRDGTVLNLEPSDISLGQFSMNDETTTGKFGVGHAIGKTMSLTIANHTNKFSMYDFYKAIIYVYVAVTLEDGTVLKERKGKYYVIEPSTTGEVINISGIDSMYLFDKPYNATTVFPATLQSILSDCCLDCGVNIGFEQFDNYDFIIDKKPEDCTYREVVSWVSQIAGYNARISNDDRLELVWHKMIAQDSLIGGNFFNYNEESTFDGGDFNNYDDVILFDGGNFTDVVPDNVTRIKSLKVSTDDVIITGVKVKNGNDVFTVGEEDYCITIQDNDLTIGKEQEIAEYLANKLIGLQFRPLTCEIPNNPLFESFDSCYVYDRKGNSYFTLINSVLYAINGFTTISCKADTPTRNESSYTSESAKAVVKAKKETAQALSVYDKAVQNMNMLSANAMGLYRESETLVNGGVIYYMSNKPIFKNEDGKCEFIINSVVYKMTGDGFFVSTDGGVTYTSGFDAEGNAVVNVLSAIGITFDWAKGGTLTLGGADNTNGVLSVLDKDGKEVGRWDNSGITLPPNTSIKWSQIEDAKNQVTQITENTVTTEYLNGKNIEAGSVKAENITGTTLNGKKITGSDIVVDVTLNKQVRLGNSYKGLQRVIIDSDGKTVTSRDYELTYVYYTSVKNGESKTINLPEIFKEYSFRCQVIYKKNRTTGNVLGTALTGEIKYDETIDYDNASVTVTNNIMMYDFYNGKIYKELTHEDYFSIIATC